MNSACNTASEISGDFKCSKGCVSHPMERDTGGIRLFVYGTLKRGCSNHEGFCKGFVSVQPGSLRGRLYAFSCGSPVVVVPPEDILTRATASPLESVAAQARFEIQMASHGRGKARGADRPGGWRHIRGEILTFDDPESRLPLLDQFEEFFPSHPSPYERVLLPVYLDDETILTAWVYALGLEARGLTLLNMDSWPC